MFLIKRHEYASISLIIQVLGFSPVWMKSNLVLLCVQNFDVRILVIKMFETILMWLEIYYQVFWDRFGMV